MGCGYLDCEQATLAVVFLCLVQGISMATVRSGVMANIIDIGSQYSAILKGMGNFAANIPGIVAPLLVGAIVTEGTQMQWRYVFFISGGCFIISLITFLLFAQGKTQEWAKDYDDVNDIEEYQKVNT